MGVDKDLPMGLQERLTRRDITLLGSVVGRQSGTGGSQRAWSRRVPAPFAASPGRQAVASLQRIQIDHLLAPLGHALLLNGSLTAFHRGNITSQLNTALKLAELIESIDGAAPLQITARLEVITALAVAQSDHRLGLLALDRRTPLRVWTSRASLGLDLATSKHEQCAEHQQRTTAGEQATGAARARDGFRGIGVNKGTHRDHERNTAIVPRPSDPTMSAAGASVTRSDRPALRPRARLQADGSRETPRRPTANWGPGPTGCRRQ